jgi:hypothetical protein
MTISEGEVEESCPVVLEVVRAYRPWKPRGRVRWHWERHVRVQALEAEEVMVLELSLPKPGGMCYRHNLTGPEDGPRATWAEGDNRLAALVRDPRCKGSTLLCSRLVDLICYGNSLYYKNSV